MEEQDQIQDYTIKPLDDAVEKKGKRLNKGLLFLGLAALLGLVSGGGLVFYRQGFSKGGSEMVSSGQKGTGVKLEKGKVYGSDQEVFKDMATGVIERNKDEKVKEGTHRLLREGGESQTVYLTSSALDLDMFVGKKVNVWGETFSSTKVGWLMDVGKVKVLE